MSHPVKYIHELGPLFEKVQTSRVFADNKTFPDCLPNISLEEINARFSEQKEQPGFDLKTFVLQYFTLPPETGQSYESDRNMPAKEHIEELWEVLERKTVAENGSLIPLPYPYVVPGGRFREVYYWDSYFTMLGLRISGRNETMRHMVDNFSYMIQTIGHIPNANRTYYIGRSQPPFYSLMVSLLAQTYGNGVFIDYLPFLEKEYQFWMDGEDLLDEQNKAVKRVVLLPDGTILNRYWDKSNTPRPESYVEDLELSHISDQEPEVLFRNLRAAAESGWDFSSRWFKNPEAFESIHTTDLLPVDLNCLLYYLEITIAKGYLLEGRSEEAGVFQNLSESRKRAIEKYCWNEEEGFYFDYDFVAGNQKDQFTLAAAFPLFFELAPNEKALKVAGVLEDRFLAEGGLLTTLQFTSQQWDAPNGWAPLQWIAYQGLVNYEITNLAEKIRDNWTALNLKIYKETGKMTEKYNVHNLHIKAGGGEYPNQDGFGWTNGVYLKMTS
ncbi:alpha,alpha-trehalase TreF [Emticicia sp. CRIBPO]|uniref:alpha,alpha-trehalase TreF n=1 Tax=Emticicia sp. CRIBPO TaxID=2683258 RepID=UPI001412DB86|nr:alpha,alpha-trehalase TreF [Emticicia sp. CRIBPO]NBA87143.1 alpha,alpha-trehalase TreF [Emticicia sp. CRIBPO]